MIKFNQSIQSLAEKAMRQLLSINENDIEALQSAIEAITAVDNDLRIMFAQHAIIWEQLIYSFGQQNNDDFLSSLLSELKDWQKSTSSHQPLTQFYQHSQNTLFSSTAYLNKYMSQLKRDKLILQDEYQLTQDLLNNQNDVLIFLEKVQTNLIGWQTHSTSTIIAPSLLYALKEKCEDLRLQTSIGEKSLINLDLIQRKNKALICSISTVLSPSLETLKRERDLHEVIN
jgi:uncharacterized protein YaaN involved in tellurite resistance